MKAKFYQGYASQSSVAASFDVNNATHGSSCIGNHGKMRCSNSASITRDMGRRGCISGVSGFISRYWKYMASFKISMVLIVTLWQLLSVRQNPPLRFTSTVATDRCTSTSLTRPLNDTAVVYFSKPRARFHGNHWFHIGEYYLSRHRVLPLTTVSY